MKLEGIKALLFDWHGVLDLRKFKDVEERIAYYAGKLNSADLKVLHGRADDYARGIMFPEDSRMTMSPEEFWKFIGSYYQINPIKVQQDLESYLISVDELNKPLWNTLPDLSLKYKLGILSDCPPDKTELIRKEVDLSIFEGRVYFSSEHSFTKK